MAAASTLAAIGVASGVANIGMGIWGSIRESEALEEQAKYQAEQLRKNMEFAEDQARDAVARGEIDIQKVKRFTKQLQGSQRAAAAAQGIGIDSGSALDLQEDANRQMIEDMAMIKANAAREAWGYKVQAAGYGTQAGMALRAGANAAQGSLISGGARALGGIASVANSWGAYSGGWGQGGQQQQFGTPLNASLIGGGVYA